MKKIAGYTLLVLIVAMFVAFAVWWTAFKYNDCLDVGHDRKYCIIKIFSN